MSCNPLLVSLILGLAAPLPPRQTAEVLQGSWVVVSVERDPSLGTVPERMIFQFEKDKVSMFTEEGKPLATFDLKTFPEKKPQELVLTTELAGKKYLLHGIYQREKEQLVICLASAVGDLPLNESDKPTEFKGGKNLELLKLEPAKKGK